MAKISSAIFSILYVRNKEGIKGRDAVKNLSLSIYL